MKLGVLVNPVAGIGGPLGLKGSDEGGAEALLAGAHASALDRAKEFVELVEAHTDWQIVSMAGTMGGFGTVIDWPEEAPHPTTAADTAAAAAILAPQVDLLCFLGGDGTARVLAESTLPGTFLGVPAGVKITSPVFSHTISEAVELLRQWTPELGTQLADVTDLDEAAYRAGRVDVQLYGALQVPLSPLVQGGKCATGAETDPDVLVEHAMRIWDPDATHIIGAGSIMAAIKRQFWGAPTLLGVDVIENGRIVLADGNAKTLAAHVLASKRPVHLWLSPIGGQAVLMGRGTQVLSPELLEIIDWEHVHAVSPPEKILGHRELFVDAGSLEFERRAPKYLRVIQGYNETRLMRLQTHAAQIQETESGK